MIAAPTAIATPTGVGATFVVASPFVVASRFAAATTATTTARTSGGQLLAGLLQHRFRISARPDDPHQQVVAAGHRIEQQGRIEAEPAVDQLLLRFHRHSHQLVLGAPQRTVRAPLATLQPLTPIRRCELETWGCDHLAIACGFGRLGTAATTATAAAAARALRGGGGGDRGGCRGRSKDFGPSRRGRTHQARDRGQGLEGVTARQHRHMTEAPTAGAGAAKQFVDVLTLALAGEFDQAQFGELGNLGARRIVTHGLGEMLQQLQLIAARFHIDEIDHHDAADVAQLQLTGNLDRRLAVGPEHGFPGIGGTGEGARVDVNDGERLSGLDDHVTAGRQLHPGLEGVADGGVDLVMLKDLGGLVVGLHLHVDLISRQIGLDPSHRIGRIDHHPHQFGAVEVAQDAMDEVFVAVEQHRWAGGFSRLLDGLPLAQQ